MTGSSCLHEHVLLGFTWAFSVLCLFSHFFTSPPPLFLDFFLLPSLLTFIACPIVAWCLRQNFFSEKKKEKILLALTTFFTVYLAYGVFETEANGTLVKLFWFYVALSGSLFLNYHYVTFLLAVAYVGMGLVHLALPVNTFDYPVWVYMVFVPLLMMGFFYITSQSILNHRRVLESERNLRRITKEQNNILDALSEMVAYKDKNNNYLSVNQALADYFGRKKEDIIGYSLDELLGPEIAKQYHEEDRAILENGKPMYGVIQKVPTPNGEGVLWLRSSKIPYFDENGKVAGLVFSAEDVTDKVLAEQRLKESEERFRMIFEKAPDGMGLIAISNHTFIKVNQAMANMVGLGEEELIGKSPTEIAHPEDRYLTLSLFNEAVKNGLTEYFTEQRLVKKDGTVIICRLSVHIVREAGRPKYLISLYQDVTLKKENERQLELYATKLEESNQNLQEFAYAASHDLREPLRTVVSYVQLMKRYLKDEDLKPEVYEFMDFVVNGSQRMDKQISALLQYSRVGRGDLKKDRVDLNRSLEIVKAGLYAQIKESNALITNDLLPTVVAEQSQIEALIQNLISNSLKYQKRGQQPQIHISSFTEKNEIVISIADNGIGIEAEQLDKIFIVFSRLHTQGEYPGSGVGLAICRRIIKRHEGEIWVESEPGKGSTFYFSLPVLKSENQELQLLKATASPIV